VGTRQELGGNWAATELDRNWTGTGCNYCIMNNRCSPVNNTSPRITQDLNCDIDTDLMMFLGDPGLFPQDPVQFPHDHAGMEFPASSRVISHISKKGKYFSVTFATFHMKSRKSQNKSSPLLVNLLVNVN
jgi:hypothetical protein